MSDNEFKVGDMVTTHFEHDDGAWEVIGTHRGLLWLDQAGQPTIARDARDCDPYPPLPPIHLFTEGERVRATEGGYGRFVVLCVGETLLFVRSIDDGQEGVVYKANVEPDVEPWQYPGGPERWINVYPEDTGDDFNGIFVIATNASRQAADKNAEPRRRIGVLHLFPDGHTEMEAP